MVLIKTDLRTNEILRLDNCIFRFAASLSENLFQGCLHENSETRGNHKAPNLLRHSAFCSWLYFSPITYLLWSFLLFATFNHLHDLYQRPLYEAVTGASPFIQILNTGNGYKSAFEHQLERNCADSQWPKICPSVSVGLLPQPFSKKRRVKAKCWQPNEFFEETVWFQVIRGWKNKSPGDFSGTLSFINQECISYIPPFPNSKLNQRSMREKQNPSSLVFHLTASSSMFQKTVFQAIP